MILLMMRSFIASVFPRLGFFPFPGGLLSQADSSYDTSCCVFFCLLIAPRHLPGVQIQHSGYLCASSCTRYSVLVHFSFNYFLLSDNCYRVVGYYPYMLEDKTTFI